MKTVEASPAAIRALRDRRGATICPLPDDVRVGEVVRVEIEAGDGVSARIMAKAGLGAIASRWGLP